MTHSFEIEDAKKYGVEAAVILSSFRFWIAKNRADKINLHDGKTWTFNSLTAWQKLFPYMSIQTLRTAVNKLKDAGIIQTGNYNQKAYDKTTWYSFVDEVDQIGQDPLLKSTEGQESLCGNQQMDLLKSTNGSVEINKPIPINTNSNQIKRKPTSKSAAASASVEPEPGTDAYRDRVHALQVEALKDKNIEDFVPRGGDASQHFNAIKACLHQRASPVAYDV
jgi:hypothetical protein